VTDFTSDEKKLIEHAKKAIVKYNKQRKAKGGIDTLYAFVMSNSGRIYDGACFETTISNANICGERHAIANMVLKETYSTKVKHIVVADPVPKVQKNSTTPCGTCRHVIWELGTPDATVICIQYIQQKDGWTFPKIEKHTIEELYPHPYTPIEWG
jgi:cytidine deaminase